jgi:predicted ATP-grasp superfamily ATP-dependent carboligase
MKDVYEIKDSIPYPAFIKAYYSHLWARTFGTKGLIVRNPQELVENFERVLPTGIEVMVQKVILGRGFVATGAYIGRGGSYVSPVFSWRKIRQNPPNFGIGCVLITEKIAQAQDMTIRFMKGIGYKGMGDLGVKLDFDGQYKMIELNGRLWMQNILATEAGINFPLLEYLDFLGELDGVELEWREGVQYLDFLHDLETFMRMHRQGEIRTIEWIRSLLRSNVFAFLARDDIKPALVHSGYGLQVAKVIVKVMKMREDEDARVSLDMPLK